MLLTHKQSQQRQGRVDGANRSVADRDAVEESRALAPETTQARPRWPALDREPPGVGRNSESAANKLKDAGISAADPASEHRSAESREDGRILRRYKRCWIVERTFAWLGHFHHLVVRYDRSLTIDQAFFRIACFMIAAQGNRSSVWQQASHYRASLHQQDSRSARADQELNRMIVSLVR